MSSGLQWVFDQVDEAIILEDDCIPDASFFPFCAELLERYRDDERVMAVSGDNFQFGKRRRNTAITSRYNRHLGLGELAPRISPLRRRDEALARVARRPMAQ